MCTQQENLINRTIQSNNSSGVTGVSFDKFRNKWSCEITKGGKVLFKKRFNKKEDAIKKRKELEKEYFKEFTPIYGKSSGTKDSIKKAEKSGKEIIIMEVK